MPIIHARPDPTLAARVVRSLPLVYAEGADPALDRPPHVRAASGLVRVDGRVAVIQDDASFVALVDPGTGRARAVTLPAGEGGLRQFDDERGNKRFKLDLEACVMLPDGGREMLAAFGSGSTSAREKIVLVRGIASSTPDVRVVDASALYAGLRANAGFAGSEMNVEGAAVVGGVLRMFNRGNGAPRDGVEPVDASCDLDLAAFRAWLAAPSSAPAPKPETVMSYELGEIGGRPLGFTDVSVRGDALLYAAAAEDSPDATRDGPVAGSAIGIIRGGEARFAVVRDAGGGRYDSKIEGILPHPGDPGRLWAVIDRDDPGTPSELLEIELEGGWGVE
jgi:hypothetical protein